MIAIINNKKFTKSDLLSYINESDELTAIAFLKEHAGICEEEAIEIIENLFNHPDFYDQKDFDPIATLTAEINADPNGVFSRLVIGDTHLNLLELITIIHNDSQLEAIKYVKEHTTLGLKRCKEIVKNLASDPFFYLTFNNEVYFDEADENDEFNDTGNSDSHRVDDKIAQQALTKNNNSAVIEQAKSNHKGIMIAIVAVIIGIALAVIYFK